MEQDVLQTFELKANLPVWLNLRKGPQNEMIHY